MTRCRLVSLLAIVLLWSVRGLAALPSPRLPRTSPPAAVALSSTLDQAALPAEPRTPNPEPRSALTCAQAIARALRGNPALRAARARTDTAQAAVDRARADERPQVGLTSSETYMSEIPSLPPQFTAAGFQLGGHTSWIATLAAQQVLSSGGRLTALVRQAADAARVEAAQAARTRQQVAFQAERAYWLLAAAQSERESARQSLAEAEDHLRVAQARYQERTAARFDVLSAETQVREARQDAIAAEGDCAIAQAGLLQALGLTEGEFTAATAEPPAAPSLSLEAALSGARAQRPELLAADAQEAEAVESLRAAHAERRPTVSASAGYQVVSPETLFQLTGWNAAISARLPLLDGGRVRADLRAAEGQQEQAAAARETLRVAIGEEVRSAHAQLASATDEVVVAQERVSLAEEALRVGNVRYEAGVATATEVVDAQATLTRARQGLTRARADRAIAAASLRFATGTPIAVREVTP